MTTDQKVPDLVGLNLQWFRSKLAWTQAQLAEAAVVSERTVQRAEEGKAISAESLKSLAGALNVTIDDLRNPPKEAQELAAKFAMTRLQRVERASDLRNMIGDALKFDYEDLNDEQERAAAELHQDVRDLLDIWSDLAPMQRLDALGDVQKDLEHLARLGLAVTAGSEVLHLKVADGRPPHTLSVLYVIVSKEPKLFAIRDKTAPVEFDW
jgi:transcriptional regulator with XRE-family HTH domain